MKLLDSEPYLKKYSRLHRMFYGEFRTKSLLSQRISHSGEKKIRAQKNLIRGGHGSNCWNNYLFKIVYLA